MWNSFQADQVPSTRVRMSTPAGADPVCAHMTPATTKRWDRMGAVVQLVSRSAALARSGATSASSSAIEVTCAADRRRLPERAERSGRQGHQSGHGDRKDGDSAQGATVRAVRSSGVLHDVPRHVTSMTDVTGVTWDINAAKCSVTV
jgi:hypothetical protein